MMAVGDIPSQQTKIERRFIMLNLKRLKGFQWNVQQVTGKGETIPEIVFDEVKRVMLKEYFYYLWD